MKRETRTSDDEAHPKRSTRRGVVATAVLGVAGVGAMARPGDAAAPGQYVEKNEFERRGDLLTGSAAGQVSRLAAGLRSQTLSPDSAADGGLRWSGRIERALTDPEFGAARGDGTTDCTDALNAVFEELAGRGAPVVVPPGRWKVTDTIRLRSGVHLVMDPGATIVVDNAAGNFTGSGPHAAVFQGFQEDAVSNGSLVDLTVDVRGHEASGIAIAGASTDYLVARPTLLSVGKAGIAFLPHSSGPAEGRARRPRVEAPVIQRTGLKDASGTTADGVRFTAAENPTVIYPTIIGALGFGVIFDDSPDWQCWGGVIEQAGSTTGFEAVGATEGSPRGLLVGTTIRRSKDNGASLSAPSCIAALLNIDTTENHGVWLGSHGKALANIIRNVGRNTIEPSKTDSETNQHAGVRFASDAVGCTAAFNTVIESNSSGERTGNIVKAVGERTGRHIVFGNTFEREGGGTLKGKPYVGFTFGGPLGSKVSDAGGNARSFYSSDAPTYQLGDFDSVFVATGAGDRTVRLPAIARCVPGRVFTVKNNLGAADVLILAAAGTERIDGVPTARLSYRKAVTVVSTGKEWAVI